MRSASAGLARLLLQATCDEVAERRHAREGLAIDAPIRDLHPEALLEPEYELQRVHGIQTQRLEEWRAIVDLLGNEPVEMQALDDQLLDLAANRGGFHEVRRILQKARPLVPPGRVLVQCGGGWREATGRQALDSRAPMDPMLAAFREHSSAAPRAPIALAPDARWTREELLDRARAVAREVERLALEPGSVVGLLAPPGPGFLAGWLGLRWAKACVLLIDASTPGDEGARVARELGAAALWTIGEGWSDGDERGRLEALSPAAVRVLSRSASLKLTSGSTGAPAGIAVSAEHLLADYHQLESSMGLTSADRFLVMLPLSHSYGFSVLASPAWMRGTPLVFPGQGDPLEAAASFEASVVPSVPSWYRARLAIDGGARWPACTRLFLSAGSPLAPEVARAWRERTGRAIHVLYGSSECGGITYDRRGDAAERGSVGTPVDGVTVELVEADEGVGRVVVRSPAVASGYVQDVSANGERTSDRLDGKRFVTGDIATFRQGELFLLGRSDDWINVKGRKVNPREVESVLAMLPGVAEAAVLAQPLLDGQGELVRAVIACPEGALSYQDVVVWCRARLAAHKVPRSILFVRALPRTDRGKLDRRALLALHGPPPPDRRSGS